MRVVAVLLMVLVCRCGFSEEPEDNGRLFNQAYKLIEDMLEPGEVLIPPDIAAKSELGDHFETINPDRPDCASAFGNPDSHIFSDVRGSDAPTTGGGTFGSRMGGGRRLMVTRKACHLTDAVLTCMRQGVDGKFLGKLTEFEAKQLDKVLEKLGSEDFKEREEASASILKLGPAAVPRLQVVSKAKADAEVAARLKALIAKLQLRVILAQHRRMPWTVLSGPFLTETYSAPQFFEGPAWDRIGKKLYFTAHKKDNHQILRLEENGKASVWLDKTDDVNGQRMTKDGLLGAFAHGIVRYTLDEKNPSEGKVVYENKDLAQANDVWRAPDGSLYFTEPDFKEKKNSHVWRVTPDGKGEKLSIKMTLPNGIAVSPDGKTLYVGDSDEKLWRAFPIEADGKIGEGKIFFNPDTPDKNDPDGMTIDENGNVYATGRGGVWVISPEGKELGFIPCPAFASNVTFGGDDGKTLYITGANKVWSLQMKVRGIEFK